MNFRCFNSELNASQTGRKVELWFPVATFYQAIHCGYVGVRIYFLEEYTTTRCLGWFSIGMSTMRHMDVSNVPPNVSLMVLINGCRISGVRQN